MDARGDEEVPGNKLGRFVLKMKLENRMLHLEEQKSLVFNYVSNDES